MADVDEAVGSVRSKAHRALRIVSSTKLLALMAEAGFPLTIDSPTLRQFANGKGTSSPNVEALSGYFSETDLGKALAGAALADSRMVFEKGLDIPDGKWPYSTRLEGNYFVYHGSHLHADKVVIRALEIRRSGSKRIEVEDRMRDNRTATDRVHKASGLALTLHPWLQIVTYHRDNSVGVRTMNMTDIDGAEGGMLGHVTGLTKVGQMFRRAVRLRRITHLSLDEMVPQTGIYLQQELQSGELARHVREFEFLKARYPDENGYDPLQNVWVKSDDPQKVGLISGSDDKNSTK